MTTTLYIPLDERPCNFMHPQALLESIKEPRVILKTPPLEILGRKKEPADINALWTWLEEELPTADQLLCSLDMLLFGGIAPSRLHHKTHSEVSATLDRLIQLKDKYPGLKIYAFNLIMRVPSYNSADEEPAYYATYGERIFRWGWLTDQVGRGHGNQEARQELSAVMASIPQNVREDYLTRRELNHFVNTEAISLALRGVLDFLVIPLDDCAEYGFSAAEQRTLLKQVEKHSLHQRVHIYPGADEVGSTLLCRMYNQLKGRKPRVFVRYSSTIGPQIIPRYEDRPLGESIKSQITVCGGVMVDNALEADLVLMVNSPTLNNGTMQEASQAVYDKDTSYYSFRNVREFTESITYYLQSGRKVALADVAFGNGADHELMGLLEAAGILGKLHSYAGWNTPGNTVGTVLAHSLIRLHDPNDTSGQPCKFVLDRYLEDWGYQVLVRTFLAQHADELGITYHDLRERQPEIKATALEMLQDFIRTHQMSFHEQYELESVEFPWNRLFEISLTTTLGVRALE